MMLTLASLQAHNRLVIGDVVERLDTSSAEHKSDTPRLASPAERLLRVSALVAWQRRRHGDLLRCAFSLLSTPDGGGDVGSVLAGGAFAFWLRALYRRGDVEDAWRVAVEMLTEWIEGDWAAGADLDALLGKPGAESASDIVNTLLDAKGCFAGSATVEEALARARDAEKPDALLIASSVAGMLQGALPVLRALGLETEMLSGFQPELDAVESRADRMPRLERLPDRHSDTHPLQVAWLSLGDAQLGLSKIPGESNVRRADGSSTERDLDSDLDRLRALGATDVVCMLPADELMDLGLSGLYVGSLERDLGFLHVPTDVIWQKEPWARQEHESAMAQLVAMLKAGRRPVLHSRNPREDFIRFAREVHLSLLADTLPEDAERALVDLVDELDQAMSIYDSDEVDLGP